MRNKIMKAMVIGTSILAIGASTAFAATPSQRVSHDNGMNNYAIASQRVSHDNGMNNYAIASQRVSKDNGMNNYATASQRVSHDSNYQF